MFYCREGLGKLETEFVIAPRSEIESFIEDKRNPENEDYSFSTRIREFEKIFRKEEEFQKFEEQTKFVKELNKKN